MVKKQKKSFINTLVAIVLFVSVFHTSKSIKNAKKGIILGYKCIKALQFTTSNLKDDSFARMISESDSIIASSVKSKEPILLTNKERGLFEEIRLQWQGALF